MIVGRHRSCDLILTDDTISGRHCKIDQTPEGYVIEDLGSSNGTFINGKRIETSQLKDNDSVVLGIAKFVFIDGQLIPQSMLIPKEVEVPEGAGKPRKRGKYIIGFFVAATAVLGVSADLVELGRFFGSDEGQQLSGSVAGSKEISSSDDTPTVVTQNNNETSNAKQDLFTTPNDLEQLIENARSAVVEIECGNIKGTGWPLAVEAKAVIVTNHHVIEECAEPLTEISINSADRSTTATSVVFDEENDLAILVTGEDFDGLPTTQMPQIGHWVMSVGNPFGLDRSVNFGTVSNVESAQIILDVAINSGNSGGPLINADGNVVGVISAVVSNADNVGIAIPLKQLCEKILNCSQGDW